MRSKFFRSLLFSLGLGTAGAGCTDEPLVSMPTSAAPEPGGSPTSFPNATAPGGTAGEPTTGEATAVDATSTGEPATDSSATSPAEPFCGDGVVAGGEECDDGPANGDTAACTLDCKLAVCGDGLVWAEGGEECDDGPGNSDSYNGCSTTCALGPHCGDGILDLNYETCDRGPLNGTGQTTDEFAPCSSMCGFFGRLLFITGEMWKGDLGGVSGADLKCQAAAKSSGLPNPTRFRSWLSDDFQSPAERFEAWDSPVPVILVGGVLVAADLGELAEFGPLTGISRTPVGQVLVNRLVHTNTSAFGEIFSVTDHCDGWTSASAQLEARRGYNALAIEEGPDWQDWQAERWWTSFKSHGCDVPAHLYCIDDGELVDSQD
jgi:hypothetical protein